MSLRFPQTRFTAWLTTCLYLPLHIIHAISVLSCIYQTQDELFKWRYLFTIKLKHKIRVLRILISGDHQMRQNKTKWRIMECCMNSLKRKCHIAIFVRFQHIIWSVIIVYRISSFKIWSMLPFLLKISCCKTASLSLFRCYTSKHKSNMQRSSTAHPTNSNVIGMHGCEVLSVYNSAPVTREGLSVAHPGSVNYGGIQPIMVA